MPIQTRGQTRRQHEEAHQKVIENIHRKFQRENEFRGELDTVMKSPIPLPKKKRRTTDFFGSTIRIENSSLTEPMEFRVAPIPSSPYSKQQEIERALNDNDNNMNNNNLLNRNHKKRSFSMPNTNNHLLADKASQVNKTKRRSSFHHMNAINGRSFNNNSILGNSNNNNQLIPFNKNRNFKKNKLNKLNLLLILLFILSIGVMIYVYFDIIYNTITDFHWDNVPPIVKDSVYSLQRMYTTINANLNYYFERNLNAIFDYFGYEYNNCTIAEPIYSKHTTTTTTTTADNS